MCMASFINKLSGVEGDNKYGPGVRGLSTYGLGVEGLSHDGVGVYGYSNNGYAPMLDEKTSGPFCVPMGEGHNNWFTRETRRLAFKIDHPLDPHNKYLSHSFVESPDMKNIYDGVVVFDDKGGAEIKLPDWFGALNKDFRYQLTAMGAPGPNLYIAEEICEGKYKL